MPVSSHSVADNALIYFAEAKKKQIQKGEGPPQSRRMFNGTNTELREITVLRQFWVPMLFKKHDLCRLPEEVWSTKNGHSRQWYLELPRVGSANSMRYHQRKLS